MLLLRCSEPSLSRLTSRDSAFPRGPLAASPAFTLSCVASSWCLFLVFRADSWFRLVDSPALVCFFSPDCDFRVVIVHVVSLSRCFVRDFSSGLFLQLHLVVVYSDLALLSVLCYGVVAGPAPVR